MVKLPSKPERALIESVHVNMARAVTGVSSDPSLRKGQFAHPCEYGERRDSFDFEFKNKVDLEKVLNSRITNLNSPDYLDSSLVEEKQNLRDIDTIPSITVQVPTPEKVQLRPVLPSASLPCPFNVPSVPAQAIKPSVSLFPVDEESLSTYSSLDTRTPSRLTFHEKVAKFRAKISIGSGSENELELPPRMTIQNNGLNDGLHPNLDGLHDGIGRGIVTSTPAVSRSIQAEKVPNIPF